MEKQTAQNFENHARLIPAFHFFALPVLLVNFVWRILSFKNGISFESILALAVAAALLVVSICARNFALRVQDRVIRLEMEMRLSKLLPADLQGRISQFTPSQLIALRFSGDEELVGLARQVLDEKLTDRKAIKRRIKNWRPDHMRA